MARTRLARALAGARKRQTLWTGGVLALQQLAGGSAGFATLISEATFANLGRPTVIRIRGQLHAQMDRSAEVAEDKATVVTGIAMVESNAVTAGIASLPTPATNVDYSWMWIGVQTLSTPTTLTEDEGPGRFQRLEIDAKAMRKANPSMALVLVTQVVSVIGTPDVECWGYFRQLLMAT